MSPGRGPNPARLSRCKIFWSSFNGGSGFVDRRLRELREAASGGGLISFSPSDNDPLGKVGLIGAMGEGRGCCAENGTAYDIASANTQRITDEERTREAFKHFILFLSSNYPRTVNRLGGAINNNLSQVMMEDSMQSRQSVKKKR